MKNYYRVTAAKTSNPKGYLKFSLQLDGNTWASMLAPNKSSEKERNRLYQFYLSNNQTLNNLINKYVHLLLEKNKYGYEIKRLYSYDIISDFKELLDKHHGKPFETFIPIYELLKNKNYPLNSDGSITLRPPYSNLNIYKEREAVICYRNDLKEDYATRESLKLIYDRFYSSYKDNDNNPDRATNIVLGRLAIRKITHRYHKTMGGIESSSCIDLLRLGDKLSDEHLRFLSETQQAY